MHCQGIIIRSNLSGLTEDTPCNEIQPVTWRAWFLVSKLSFKMNDTRLLLARNNSPEPLALLKEIAQRMATHAVTKKEERISNITLADVISPDKKRHLT